MIRPTRKELRAILRSDFNAFNEMAFQTVSPTTKFLPNWHLDRLCWVAQSLHSGRPRRIIINAPPRSLKSFIFSAALPAYLLGCDPSYRIICASYSDALAAKHAADFRLIIAADKFQKVFGKLRLAKETDAEVATTAGGFRLTTSVGGSLTGRGGYLIIIDDPLNASDAASKTSREAVNEWFRTTVMSRLDNPSTGSIIIVMQRLHVEDLSGTLLSQGGWEHICLPAIAPEDLTIDLGGNRKFFWKVGAPLHQDRLPLAELDRQRKALGTAAFSAQYLQAPVPPEGGMLKKDWLKFVDTIPSPRSGDQVVQSWDTALKAKDSNDYSVGLSFLIRGPNEIYLTNVSRQRLEFPELVARVGHEALAHAADTVLIEEHGSGISLVQTMKSQRGGVIGLSHEKDKATRMYSATPLLEGGLLRVPQDANWLGDFLEEYLAFPNARHDDQIDALSQFLNWFKSSSTPIFDVDWGWTDDQMAGEGLGLSVPSLLSVLLR